MNIVSRYRWTGMIRWISVLLVAGLVASLTELALAADKVRVVVHADVPQIEVDGQPVRARMFWGAPGARPLHIGPEGQLLSFEFTPREDEPGRATLHFRFGRRPGSIWLDDIRVRELPDGPDTIPRSDFTSTPAELSRDWTVWPPAPDNTVGKVTVSPRGGRDDSAALHIQLQNPATGPWPDFHIYHVPNLALRKQQRYRVSLWARADTPRDLTVAFYRPGQTFTYLGGPPDHFARQIKLAAGAGVRFVSFPVHMPWPKPGTPPDWSTSDRQCQEVLDANPDALLLPRIGMGPPQWWRTAHPDDMMVWDKQPVAHQDVAVASPRYRREAAAHLAALIERLEDRFGPHMAGYHPCGQNTGEWFYQNTWGPALNGYAPVTQTAWHQWLRGRYPTDSALRHAWHNDTATLAAAPVPTSEQRRDTTYGALLNPAKQQALIDFAEFQQDMMADCVAVLAHAARTASHGRRLVVFFFGYVFEFGAIRNGPATAGHYALRRVLQNPDIDILCSPISYWDRGIGQSAPAMTAAESVALAGKMWLYEDDTRTYLATGRFPGWQSGADTRAQTIELLLRNTGQCAVRNFGTWWMDLGSSGWFDDPQLWQQMRLLAKLDDELVRHPRPFRPEVAAVLDTASMCRVAYHGDTVTRPGIYEVRQALGRMGAPYGQYLMDDLLAGRIDAKVIVVLNAWSRSRAQQQQLRRVTQRRLAIWCYAPGYDASDPLGSLRSAALTPFQLQPVTLDSARVVPTAAGQRAGLHTPFGPKTAIRPLLAVADGQAGEVLARYKNGSAAVVLRQTANRCDLFVGPPGLTAELLRVACRAAGVHLFTQVDCNFYQNGPFLVLHAAQDGPLRIDTGAHQTVRDVLSGTSLGTGPIVTLPIRRGETRILQRLPDGD